VSAFLTLGQTGDDEPELDSAQGAAAHVRNFLGATAQ
jgi:hypothetical protein